MRERAARDDEASHVLRQVARESNELAHPLDELPHFPAAGVEPGLSEALPQDVGAIPPRERSGQPVELPEGPTRKG